MEPQTETRLTSIEQRLEAIERHLDISATPVLPMVSLGALQKPILSGVNSDNSQNIPSRETTSKVADAPAKPGNWLGIIGILCFILAAGFIVKLSIDSGWLSPLRQIGIAGLLGLGLIGTGLVLLQTDSEYASLLPGAGIVILYLSVFAANRFYELISFEAALSLTALVSALSISLYWKIRHDVYPVTAAVGAFLAPAVLGLHAEATFSIFYFLIASVGFALISSWMNTRTLALISAYLAIVMTAFVGIDLKVDGLVSMALGLQFLVVLFGTFLFTLTNGKSLTSNEAWSFLPVLLIFYAAEYFYLDRLQPGLAPWISLGFAAVLLVVFAAAKNMLPGKGETSRPVVLAYAAIVAFHSIYLELMPDDAKPWLFVAIVVAAALASKRLAAIDHRENFFIPAFTLLTIAGIEYLSMIYHLISDYDPQWLGVSLVSVAAIWGMLIFSDEEYLRRRNLDSVLLGCAHALAILALYRVTTDVGSLAVSASWLFYAVAVMIFAVIRKNELMAKSALAVLGFAAGKALLHDAASAPTVVRIFCLLLTGAVLYGCGLFMRRVKDWSSPAS